MVQTQISGGTSGVDGEADSVKTAAMRAMLPKDVLERFLDGPFHYGELRNRVSACVGEKLAGQDANGGAQPMDIGQIDKSEGEDEDVNQCGDTIPLERAGSLFAVRFWIPNGFHRQG